MPSGAHVLFLRGPGLGEARVVGRRVEAERLLPSPEPLAAELRFLLPVPDEHAIELPTVRLLTPGKADLYAVFEAPEGTLAVETSLGGFEPMEAETLAGTAAAEAGEAGEVFVASAIDPPAPPRYDLHRLESTPMLTAQIRRAEARTHVAQNGRFLTRLELEVVSSTKPFVTLTLPPSLRVVGAETRGRPILAAEPEAGRIALPLASTRGEPGRVAILLAGEIRWPSGSGRLELPALPFDIPVAAGSWTLELPRRWSARLAAGSPWLDHEVAPAAPSAPEAPPASDVLAAAVREALDDGVDQARRRPVIPSLPSGNTTIRVSTLLPGSTLPELELDLDDNERKEAWQ